MAWQRAKGALPAVGEYWMIAQDVTNSWTFALCMSTPGTVPVANGSGFFWYSGGIAAPGALVMSAAAAPGSNDGAGNAFVAGFALYSSAGHRALAVNGETLTVYTAPGHVGPWTAESASIQFGGGLFSLDTAVSSTVIQAVDALVSVFGIGEVPSSWEFDIPLTVTEYFSVSGPASFSGTLTATAGTASSPSVVSTDVWHDLRPLNTGFDGTVAGYYPPQYRLTTEQRVEIFGVVSLPGSGYNGVTWSAIGDGYTPNLEVYLSRVAMISNSGSPPGNSASMTLSVAPDGNLQFHNIPSGGGSGPIFINDSFPLDASGLIQS
jgi:hypothetical protein